MIVCPVPSIDRFFIGQLIKGRVSIVGLILSPSELNYYTTP
nr:MAG TPA: hypothetical protein [Caudoviricetes sp.]